MNLLYIAVASIAVAFSLLLYGEISGILLESFGLKKNILYVEQQYPKEIDVLHGEINRMIKKYTDGYIQLNITETKNVQRMFERVKSGETDAAILAPYFWGEIDPVLYIISSSPFTYLRTTLYRFYNSIEGQKFFDEIGKKFNMIFLPCSVTGIQISGWLKKPLERVDEFKGKKIREVGLAEEIYKRLGAEVSKQYPYTELKQLLADNKLDMVEWSTPSMDYDLGFYKVAKTAMVPGWHEPGNVVYMVINRDVWEKLSSLQQQRIRDGCESEYFNSLIDTYVLDGEKIGLMEKERVNFLTWSNEFMEEFYAKWISLRDEKMRISPQFKKFHDIIEANFVEILANDAGQDQLFEDFFVRNNVS